jgi:hypothetical protein
LSGTIPSAVLGNSTVYIGTTAVALNRSSASISLTGTNIDGSAGSATTATTATNATNIAITDDTSSTATFYPTFVSNTTGNLPQLTSSTKLQYQPSTGTTTSTIIQAGTQANYIQATGGATTKAVQFQSLGSDGAVSLAIQSKGTTGAIDLSAGSSGVNVSNGGTVTALTRTAAGVSYTSPPSVAISAPTTAGGVQATATSTVSLQTIAVNAGGSGYLVGDVLTLVGGTGTAATVTVATLSGSAVATVNITSTGAYTVIPTNPISVTGGTGTSATFTASSYALSNTINITAAGSGYVEQPTVTFSGGGGSGAAAYATVGGGTIIRALGSTGTQSLDFYTPAGITSSIPALRLRDVSSPDTYLMLNAGSLTTALTAQGNANGNLFIASNGTGRVSVLTNGTSQTEQFRISHTASAVNYVQITGGIAGTPGTVTISSSGSSANVDISLAPKGSGVVKTTSNAYVGSNLYIAP